MPDWQPAASLGLLRARAKLLADIRAFFQQRGVLEVATPQLCIAGVTDPAIEPLMVTSGSSLSGDRYLQTSPEYGLKRLLASGSGPIYEIARVFRDGEVGPRHNPEFTLLEWYRPGLDYHQLMAEVADLLIHCLGARSWSSCSYRQLFLDSLNLDPFGASDDQLLTTVREHVDIGDMEGDRDVWLDLLLSHVIEPSLRTRGMLFVYDYPATQAALSAIVEVDGHPVGQRFELYVDGIELANGYCELLDPLEQRARFEADNQRRLHAGQQTRPLDEKLLAAMEHGLPDCSGVALGIDRLLMVATGERDIRKVISFDWQRS